MPLGVRERCPGRMPRQAAALHRWGNPKSNGETPWRSTAVAVQARSLVSSPSLLSLPGTKLLAKPCLEKAAKIGPRGLFPSLPQWETCPLRSKAGIRGGHLKTGAQAGRGIPAEARKRQAVIFATVHLLFDLIKLYLWRWLLFFVKSFNLKSH